MNYEHVLTGMLLFLRFHSGDFIYHLNKNLCFNLFFLLLNIAARMQRSIISIEVRIQSKHYDGGFYENSSGLSAVNIALAVRYLKQMGLFSFFQLTFS